METVKETLQLLSMQVAEKDGPVLGPLPSAQAIALDNRIIDLMYEAYCLGRNDALKQLQEGFI